MNEGKHGDTLEDRTVKFTDYALKKYQTNFDSVKGKSVAIKLENCGIKGLKVYQYKKTGKKLKSKRNVAEPRNNLIVQSYDTENMLKTMKAFDGKDCKLFVRCHPKENLDVWKYLFKKCSIDIEISDSLTPITHWLEDIDVLIGPPSTTFYDAAIEKTRCISIINLDKNRLNYIGELWEENNELMKDISAPQTIQEIVDDAMIEKDFILTPSLKETLMSEAH